MHARPILTAAVALGLLASCSDDGSSAIPDGGGDGSARAAVNEPCQQDDGCQSGVCHAGICASSSPAGQGAACSGDGDCLSFHCVSGKCAAGDTADGQACLQSEQCRSGTCTAGKCEASLKKDGEACTLDGQCGGGICFEQRCTRSCTAQADCQKGQDCGSDDGVRLLCHDRGYDAAVGQSCAVTGKCPSGLSCRGTQGDAGALCTAACKTDLDCPPRLACMAGADGKRTCRSRGFCHPCQLSDQCAPGYGCLSYKGEKFCTKACAQGSTECEMYAECADTGGGKTFCLHKAGKCAGAGDLCDPCRSEDDCKAGGFCLTLSVSEEPFCGTDCVTDACPKGYTCAKVGGTDKQCTPRGATLLALPSCHSPVTRVMNVGDVSDDFAMVGYADNDNDGALDDEQRKVVRFSDYAASHKIILFNIAGFW